MTTRAQLNREADKHGATVEDDSSGRWRVLQIVAPEGKLWVDGSCTCLRVEWIAPGATEAFDDAIARMNCGLEEDDGW